MPEMDNPIEPHINKRWRFLYLLVLQIETNIDKLVIYEAISKLWIGRVFEI